MGAHQHLRNDLWELSSPRTLTDDWDCPLQDSVSHFAQTSMQVQKFFPCCQNLRGQPCSLRPSQEFLPSTASGGMRVACCQTSSQACTRVMNCFLGWKDILRGSCAATLVAWGCPSLINNCVQSVKSVSSDLSKNSH